jgi:hypothetical protein
MRDDELAVLQACMSAVGFLSMCASATTLVDHYQNRKDRRNLMSRQVAVLCSIDLVVSLFLTIGVAGTMNNVFCKFQGFFLQWGFLGSVLWNLAMGNQIYRLIVEKKSEEKLMKRLKMLAGWMVALSLLVAIILVGDGRIGDSTLFCWIESNPTHIRYAGFFWFLLVSWMFSIYYFVKISNTIKAHTTSSQTRGAHITVAENQIRSKLRTFLIIFIYVWFFVLLNNIVESINGEPVFATTLLEAIILPSQGLLNAIFYGGLLNDNSLMWKLLQMGDIEGKIKNLGSNVLGTGKARRKSSMRNYKVWEKEVVCSPRKISVFSTTFNQGEALYSELGDFSKWILPGHDVYSIGVQECMCLDEFRAGLMAHLGGPGLYTMYCTEIGSSNTRLGFHGYIALTVFVRRADLLSGAVKLVESASKEKLSGANLIVTTAANKGAVGLLFHIHDITIGFVTAHLPSDSKGKSKLPKRNATAQDVLRDLVLAADDLGCDVQHQHDYMIMMGDLNYRMNTPHGTTGLKILQLIAEAATVEKAALGEDTQWLNRKYALMNAPSSPDFPSPSEAGLLQAAEETAMPAWDAVLVLDELCDMMNLGEVYSGFTEPMPRFPPSYKRKVGYDEACCGDYSDIMQVLQGFSHIGEELPSGLGPAAGAGAGAELRSSEVGLAALPDSALSPAPAPHMEAFKEEGEEDGEEEGEEGKDTFGALPAASGEGINGQDSSSSSADSSPSKPSAPAKAKANRRASLLAFVGVGQAAPSAAEDAKEKEKDKAEEVKAGGGDGGKKDAATKKRRTSVFNALRSADSIAAAEHAAAAAKEAKAKSKIRPPSYTDRILIHSLPDRADKLSVTAYGFCDDIRASDHRPVCMTYQIEVNSLVSPQGSLPTTSAAPAADVEVGKNLTLTPSGTNVILVALEIANLEATVHCNSGVSSPMLAYLGASEGNMYMSSDMDTSDSSLSSLCDTSPTRFSRSRNSLNSTRDLESNFDDEKDIADLDVAEVTVVFPLPCKDPMSVQRKMFDYVRALGLSATSDAMKKDGVHASMIRPASTAFPWAACALGDLQVGYV